MDNLFCASHDYDNNISLLNVKSIFIPDDVIWSEENLLSFNQLDTVSLSVRDYWKNKMINQYNNWNYTLRLPIKEEFMHTKKTDSMAEFMFQKCGKKKLHDRFASHLAMEYVNHSWTEEQALVLMASTAIESGTLHDRSVLGKWLDPETMAYLDTLYSDMTICQKARFISNNSLLKSVYAIRSFVDEKLEITANDDLYHFIQAGQKIEAAAFLLNFNETVSVGKNCLLGFDGTGSLKGTEYSITGESTPEMNMHIIRLTSDYQLQRKPMYRAVTPNLLKLNFLGQHWFEKNAQMGRLWSLPGGEIYDKGYVESNLTVEDILTDLACIGSQFKGLEMELQFSCSASTIEDAGHIPYKKNCLVFALRQGTVSVAWNNPVYLYRNGHYDVREYYSDKQFQCKALLDTEYINCLERRNFYETVSDNGRQESEHIAALKHFDEYILFVLEMHMKEKYGWSFHFHDTAIARNHTDLSFGYQLLRLLFRDYDINEIIEMGRKCEAEHRMENE